MTPQRFLEKLRPFEVLTHSLGRLSTCKKRKVGVIILPPDFSSVLAIGYNGPPAGTDNDACDCADGGRLCVHAEANALLKLRSERPGLVMLCGTSPCAQCAGLIANSRQVSLLVYYDLFEKTPWSVLLQAGVEPVLHSDPSLYQHWRALCQAQRTYR